jgi:tetratricopeptide (TPR) repeat protein
MTQQKPGFLSANKDLLMIAGLGLLVIAVYFQATRFDFINLDDNLYVYSNPALQNGLNWESVKWAFTSFWSANWHPLTWLSHGLDIQLFGLSPGSHHAVNIVLHLVNSILVFVVFRRMTGAEWQSLIVAALFAVHPAHVESVAWISERKDVLSTLFWLLTMLAYAKFVRPQESESERKGDRQEPAGPGYIGRSPSLLLSFSSTSYWLVVLLFALGLMAKPMLVTLPFVLLLCDYWPLARLQNIKDLWPRIFEKLPLFALSAASSVITFLAQRSVGAVETLDYLPIGTRLLNALVSFAKYIVMLFYPADLAVLYPYDKSIPNWQIAGSVLLLIAISAVCVSQYRRRPFLFVGWLWFLGTLVPVIGVMQVGSQALADRYTYIPYIGLFVMIVWGATSLTGEIGFRKRAFSVAAAIAILVFSGLAFRQVSYWRDNESLYRHTLAVTTNNNLIEHNLCHYFVMQDRLDEAEPLCRQAIEQNPNYDEPYNTLGILEFKRGKFADAEQDFRNALDRSPMYVFPYVNLAQAQARQGKAAEAENSLIKAVGYNNGQASTVFSAALSDTAAAYAAQGNYEKAVDNLKRLMFIQPYDAQSRAHLGFMLYMLKRYDEAEAETQNSLANDQRSAEAWNTLGLIKLAKGDNASAASAFKQVIVIDPKYPGAKENLDKANAAKK